LVPSKPLPFTEIGDVGLGDGTFGSLFFDGLTDGRQGDQEKVTEIDIAGGDSVGIVPMTISMEKWHIYLDEWLIFMVFM